MVHFLKKTSLNEFVKLEILYSEPITHIGGFAKL